MSDIVPAASDYVKQLLTSSLSSSHYYHNWDHTREVWEESQDLGKAAQLADDQFEILQLSALFHDTGFVKSYFDHETHSKTIAQEFLKAQSYPDEKLNMILLTIEATRVPHRPADKIGSLLQDADLASLASPKWESYNVNLRKERAALEQKEFTDLEWAQINLEFYKNTVYQTLQGKTKYDEQKKTNRDMLKDQSKLIKKQSNPSLINGNRTAELLFKTALRNHINLTQIADNKANIMLSINALILTFAMPILFQKATIRENWYFVVPFSIIGFCCIISIIYAALATQPGKFQGKFKPDDMEAGKGSLFFFGNFFATSLEDYTTAMKKALANEDRLDDSAILDLYFMGKSLGRKFLLLRQCYSFFLFGIIIGSVLFGLGYIVSKLA
jgi:predicted metal-dependent HD superfamily phosphohydrolase